MAGNSMQKIKLLYLIKIFENETDEEHPLSSVEICDELNKYEIGAERKSIYKDIEVLRQYGYDIINTRYPKPGFFLASRHFELAEVRLLMDAVQAASFVTSKKTHVLLNKLNELMSKYQANQVKDQVYIDSRLKYDNEEIYYNIDKLNTAIINEKRVVLQYFRREIDNSSFELKSISKTMEISPYALLWSNDHYYLIGNNFKYDNLIHLRIDRMKKVNITNETIKHFSEVSSYKNYFDIADYSKRIFNVFGGQSMLVELKCKDGLVEEILDRFGNDISLRPSEDGYFVFRANALVSDGFISWLVSFEGIEVMSPPELREKVCEKINRMQEIYK